MRQVLVGLVLSVMHCTSIASPADAQTRLRPDDAITDPRLNTIRARLQSDHGSIRPLTTYLDVSGTRAWGSERNFFYYTMERMLLEAGAEPVESNRDAQFKLYMSSQGRVDQQNDQIIETLTLTLTDLRAGGRQTIMSSSSTLECPDNRAFPYKPLVCPVDERILMETFLRLR